MTDVVVPLVAPQRQAERSELPASAAIADLYHATTADAAMAVHESGGELALAVSPDREDRAFADELAGRALPDETDVPTLELESMSPWSALEALREHSEAASVGVLDPRVGLVMRRHLDTAAMRLRREDAVIGPTPASGWYYIGTRLGIDDLPPDLERSMGPLTRHLARAEHDVGFLPLLPVIERESDLAGMRELLMAMHRSDRSVAPYTHAWLESSDAPAGTDTS